MRPHLVPIVLLVVAGSAGGTPQNTPGQNDPAEGQPPPGQPPPGQPPPGRCSYIQPQVKQCTVSAVGGVGTFEVVVTPPAGLVLNFEEPITGMQPPPSSSYKAIFSGTTATVVPLRRDPIPGATVHFDTATVHVTLNLRLGPTPDTQLLIADPRKAARDEEVERRVKDALDGLEARASERAEHILLEEMATDGAEVVDPDVDPGRHNQVVLRVKKLVRIGTRRVLLFSLENRTGEVLELRRVRLWLGSEGKERELTRAATELPVTTVAINQEVTGAVAIPGKTLSPSDRVRLRVEPSDPERTVELQGIRLR